MTSRPTTHQIPSDAMVEAPGVVVTGSVSADSRQRVITAATNLGYMPDPAARALANGGGTHVAVVVTGPSAEILRDPYVGRVVAAVAEAGLSHHIGVSLKWSPVRGWGELHRLADDRSIHGLILVNTTHTALGTLSALRDAHVDVPGDVAVAGFDDITFASLSDPALTTATHPVEQIATDAASAVLERLPTPPVTLFPSTLVRRHSA